MTTRPIKTSLADHLAGGDGGIKPGARGVVLERRGWNTLLVKLHPGFFGTVTVRAQAGQLRVTRRGGGAESFAVHAGRLQAARLGAAIALLSPLILFGVEWYLRGGSGEGLGLALIDGALHSILDVISYALADPAQALLYVGVVLALNRFAFR